MEYDHDIENVYLSVVNDQRAYREAKDLLKYLKAGAWERLKCNLDQPIKRRRPANIELRKLAQIAKVEGSYDNIFVSEKKLLVLWLKIANHIDPDFIQLDKPASKIPAKRKEQMEGFSSWLREQDHEALANKVTTMALAELNQIKETNMPIIKNVTYFKGTDIKTLDEDQLIKAIKDLESEVESLKSIKVTSKKVASNIEEIEEAINLVVAELDSRTK